MREMARWGALPLLAAPMSAWGLGLGEIELQSALNQPLEAQIRLSATAEELEGLDVSLADAATFERYGLERPAFLSSLQFEVGRNDAGNEVVFVRSARSIGEPFVTVLIEATWPRGRSLREYTMLLDPPVFVPGPAQTDPVRVAESGESSSEPGASSSAGGAIARQPAQPASESVPQSGASGSASQSGASGSASQPAAASRVGADGTYGPVQRAETLWGIANALSGNGVTTNQMMVALYEANPAAFDGNMNWLQRGAVLRVPDRADVAAIAANNATAEVQRQTAAWQGGAQTAGTEGGAQASSAQAADARQARLRLVPPSDEAAAASASPAAEGSGESAGAQGQGAGAPGEGAAVAELRNRLSSLETELEESRRLIELRDEQLSALQRQLSEANAAAGAPDGAVASAPPAAADPGVDLESEQLFVDEPTEPAEDPAGAAPEESAEAEPAPAPAASATQVVTTTQEPSFLSRMLSLLATPMVLIGAGIGALLLTALLYLRRRRDDVEDVTGRWEALEAEIDAEAVDRETTERLRRQSQDSDFIVEESRAAPEPAAAGSNAPDFESAFATPDVDEPELRADATGRFQAPEAPTEDTLSSQSVINLDQADPVAEADFHMAYGLYDQAADLVNKALEQDPSSRPLKLKLLEVYFVWGNKEAFLDAAKDLRAEMGERVDSDWDKVIIMGKQICPDESLFVDATAAAGEVDVDLDAGDGGLDFAFGGDDGAGVDLDLGAPGESDVDLALEATGESGAIADRRGSQRETDSDDPSFDEPTSDEPAARAPASSAHVLDDTLDIGAQTSAGLEEALFMLDDTGERASPGAAGADDADSLAETQESPTVETPYGAGDASDSASTMETPTVESPRADVGGGRDMDLDDARLEDDDLDSFADTMESPTVEAGAASETQALAAADDSPTVESHGSPGYGLDAEAETPTVETPMDGSAFDTPGDTVEQPRPDAENSSELTAELDLDDLGLDVEDLGDLPQDLGDLPTAREAESDTREQPALDADDELLSATGVTQVLTADEVEDDDLEYSRTSILSDEDATMMAPRHAAEDAASENTLTGTEVLEQPEAAADDSPTGHGGSGLDLDLDDFDAALGGDADTVEQPRANPFAGAMFGDDSDTPVDLDIGTGTSTSTGYADGDDPTGTEQYGLDPQTMTEVGTKLDLARAYIDMGDPEGARSILEEVLDEGDTGQKREAQSLIDVLAS